MPFTLRASNADDESRLLAVLATGLSEAVLAGALPLEQATRVLFEVYTLQVLEQDGLDPRAAELIHLGTELEDVHDLIPHALEDSLREIRHKALALLGELAHNPPTTRWVSTAQSG